ncbi:MAG: hypothetical protein ACKVJ1_02870 [Verrucomicrobiia bacterium]|jgi:hypothetical protein
MKSFTPSTLLILFTCFALSSCMEFENQELVYSHDAEKDELRITLRYQGIFGNINNGHNSQNDPDDYGTKDKLNQKQIGQLESVLKEKRAFFFSNWIFEYNPKSLSEMLESIIKNNVQGKFGQPEKDLIEALIKNVEVQNIGLYEDNKGRVCGAQALRIQNFAHILELTNQVIRRQTKAHIPQMREELEKKIVKNAFSSETINLIEKKIEEGFSFIQLDGNLLTLQTPMVHADKERIAESMLQDLPSGARIDLSGDIISIQMGGKKEKTTQIEKKCFDGYLPNARNYLQENRGQLFLKPKQITTKLRRFLDGKK